MKIETSKRRVVKLCSQFRMASGVLASSLATAMLVACSSGGSDSLGTGSDACSAMHWVNAWQAPPTDGIAPVDASLLPFVTGPMQTFRTIFSPTGAATSVRIHLSNRFGGAPVTFATVTIAQRRAGASIDPATMAAVRFAGQASVTVPAGQDVVSDPVTFTMQAFDDIAVSIYAVDAGLTTTHHHLARQTSYATLPVGGDHAADAEGTLFVQSTTLRPFVVGLDALVPETTTALVTLGDSLTDGYESNSSAGLPQDTGTIDLNQRYPDFLSRRLIAAGRKIYVSNAGISGNQVLEDPSLPDGLPTYGPALLTRLDADLLATAGVSDVLLWAGINDVIQSPGTSADALTAGYTQVISRLHARGLRVSQATLTPSNTATAEENAVRRSVNDWIRQQSPADVIVDFDAVVRDPGNPDALAAQYDGGDGLHFNAAGYARLAAAVDLNQIAGSGCE